MLTGLCPLPQGYCVQDIVFRASPSLRAKLGWHTLPAQVLARMVQPPATTASSKGGLKDKESQKLKATLRERCWEWRDDSKPWLRPLSASLGNADARSQRIRCGGRALGFTTCLRPCRASCASAASKPV